MKRALVIRDLKNKLTEMKFECEFKITELQMRLQPVTPLKLCEQREKDLKLVLEVIVDTVVDYSKLLDETMNILTTLQEDPNIHRINKKLPTNKN